MKKSFITLILFLASLISLTISSLAFNIDNPAFPEISDLSHCNNVVSQTSDSLLSIATIDSDNRIDIDKSFYLYNFNGDVIAIFYQLKPIGYAIYDFENTTVLEHSTESNHPYYTDLNQQYYFEGVFNYYAAVETGFVNLVTGQTKYIDSDYEFTADNFYSNVINNENNIAPTANDLAVYLDKATRTYNCNIAENMSYFYPDLTEEEANSSPGVCGSLASAVLLAYYDDNHSDLGDFVTDWKKTYGELVEGEYGKPIVRDLVAYIEPDADGSILLDRGFDQYLNDRDITGSLQIGLLAVYQQVKNSIGSEGEGDPIIVGTSEHYSIGVGYRNVTKKQIYTNTGYGNYAWIDASTVISTWILRTDI